ncbi:MULTISPECIES: adenylosuccinate lyase [unclassified Thermotoga]|uniref:adenylosuccinate lyase n=1 Tax=unclassified Thermotoga TaxID=2631113 RepID=UPI0004A31427|nr:MULTISPECIES: adenylosuccinate lyase [unclassified Thermotoga]AIY88951.1 adenylosuccinate lyase [Thermotoga sp. Cell2]KHC93119.1 adenylosuccinate lyase [Thermotoga sp. TBGT1765]KHC94527.1 adenylosuccinate lyase [Thermotoga sp. TBGT1766]KHC95532.1 adenylosuccinate lyase [Thermotoga sp. Xyl54]
MVERYSLSPMKDLWTEEAKYRRWLEVELAVTRAYEELGTIPKGVTERIRNNAKIDVELFKKIEERTNHDVVAFVEGIGSMIGEDSRFFHYGLTSSDVLDTANSLALVEAGKILLESLKEFCDVLWEVANRYKHTPTIGRTHGVHAEPTSFGLKVLGWYSEMKRNVQRLERAIEEVSYGKISGAVGNYANVPPEVEEKALSYLGLKPEPVSTQVVPRDRHAFYLSTLAIVAAGIERIAVEIRHLQRTEVLEVEEPFRKGQRGSSAMPHKKNPITCERLTGLSRMMRAYVDPSLENIALWHERDISHSSVERYVFPDATQTLYYMIVTATNVVRNMKVNEERMKKNIDLTKGLVFSQRVLLKLIEKGLTRKEAYDIVQRNALKTWNSEKHFLEYLLEDEEVKKLVTKEELEELFDISYYLKHVDHIFERFEKE